MANRKRTRGRMIQDIVTTKPTRGLDMEKIIPTGHRKQIKHPQPIKSNK